MFLYRLKILRIFRKDTPSSPLARSFPTGGKPFGWDASKFFSLPHWGSLTVAEGNFDHPVNGQKVNERAAGPAPGQGTALERAVDEGPFMRLRAHIERQCVYRKRPRLYRNAARHYIVQLPLITAYAELLPGRTLPPVLRLPDHSPDGRDRLRRPTPNPPQSGGEAFWFEPAPASAFPIGEGGPRGTSGG